MLTVSILHYPIVEENSEKSKADENNESNKQEASHHGKVIL